MKYIDTTGMKFKDYVYTRPDFEAVAAEYRQLAEKVATAKSFDETVEAMERHIDLYAEFTTAISICEVRHTIDTSDAYYETEINNNTENTPVVMEAYSVFYMALLNSPFRPQLEKKYSKVLFTNAELTVKTISPEVVDLLAEEGVTELEYQKLIASARIPFKGEDRTIAQLGIFKTDPDREVRRSAFCADGNYFAEHRAEFDGIFDKLVKLRTEIAHKLGFENFIGLAYCRRGRNCYDAAMVREFREEVKRTIVPLLTELKKDQARRIGVENIKLQDDSVLFKDGNPRPIGSFEDTYQSGLKLYREMRPETKEFIDFMHEHELFSLIATDNKAAGGYCTNFDTYASPFIFSNFNGSDHDVSVFTHEGGHAFEAFVAYKNKQHPELGFPTMESCEVHSMSMEFLAWPWMKLFYGDRTEDAKYSHLLSALNFIPYGCMVDEFQHIVYENPDLTPEQRGEEWSRLEKEYRPYLDLDGIPTYSEGRLWQRQNHIYLSPFYYIDYCLAQSVALQIFALIQDKGWDEAWKHYYAFLEKAGTLTFVELLEAGKLSNPFVKGSMETVCAVVNKYIAR